MPGTSVIIMNSRLAQTELVEYVRSGVSGFILKDAPLEDYLRTIRLVAEGKKVLPPPLTGSVFAQIVSDGLRNGTKKLDSSGLTRQEQKIIELIADGLRDKEIAQRLNIALATVKSHVHSILQKLHFRGRLEISNLAHKNSAT